MPQSHAEYLIEVERVLRYIADLPAAEVAAQKMELSELCHALADNMEEVVDRINDIDMPCEG